MGNKRTLAKCSIVLVGGSGNDKELPPNKIVPWTTHLGGKVEQKPSNHTTHIVASETAWKEQRAEIKKAREFNESHGTDIKIVTYTWLKDCLLNQSKMKEGQYLWEKIAKAKTHGRGKAEKQHEVKGAKNHVGMLRETLEESTEGFISERERRELDRQIETERKARMELKAAEKIEEKRKKEEARKMAGTFADGAKKGREQIFSENHHIYIDPTGFQHDVLLTKVDTRNNKNERYAITIYESNAFPHTYATNGQFSGTGRLPSSNTLAYVGASFHVAFHAFKVAFREKTGGEWDDRITDALKRQSRERGIGAATDEGSVRGVPVNEKEVGSGGLGKKGKIEADFDKMLFQYDPPTYGPRGLLPATQETQTWIEGATSGSPPNSASQRQSDDEVVMSGALEDPAQANYHDNESGKSIYDQDLDELLGVEYPFDRSNTANANMVIDPEFSLEAVPDDQHQATVTASSDGEVLPLEQSIATLDAYDALCKQQETQFGETQRAEQAGEDLMAFINHDGDEVEGEKHDAATNQASSVDIEAPKFISRDDDAMDGDNGDVAAKPASLVVEAPKLNLGSSILGKRKSAAALELGNDEEPMPKRHDSAAGLEAEIGAARFVVNEDGIVSDSQDVGGNMGNGEMPT